MILMKFMRKVPHIIVWWSTFGENMGSGKELLKLHCHYCLLQWQLPVKSVSVDKMLYIN